MPTGMNGTHRSKSGGFCFERPPARMRRGFAAGPPPFAAFDRHPTTPIKLALRKTLLNSSVHWFHSILIRRWHIEMTIGGAPFGERTYRWHLGLMEAAT
jgi:hypothetical protein